MNLADFFSPISHELLHQRTEWANTQLRMKMEIYADEFPNLDDDYFDIAIIGVNEDRGAFQNPGTANAPDAVRKKLYTLHESAQPVRVVDLGNLRTGETLQDTYAALKTVVSELDRRDILVIVIGGSQDLTWGQFQGHADLERKVDLAIIDPKFDIDPSNFESEDINSTNYLNHVLLRASENLFNLSFVGYQTYFVSQESLKVMDQLYFDAYRLGEFLGKTHLAEPVLRNAHMISFDLSAIRISDAPANDNAVPNGFYGEDACQLCRYAGMSDKLRSIGFFEYNPRSDMSSQSAMLMAQMIWYFIEGVGMRKDDFPSLNSPDYIIYRTQIRDSAGDVTFVKSKKSERWWMQVPYPNNKSNNELYHWVPCSYDEYLCAKDGELPELWNRTYQKLF